MQLKKLLTEEQAVSSVIATILMVAVVVILAALIGTLILGLGSENAEVGPSASISIEAGQDYYDYSGAVGGGGDSDEDGITITHEGGDSIETSTIRITVDGKQFTTDSGEVNGSISGLVDPSAPGTNATEPSNPWESGESYVFVENANNDDTLIEDGDTVRVIWQSQNTNQTATIAKDTISL